MMLHIRQQAQAQLPEAITQAVIGRPINFRGWAAMKQTPGRKGFWNARRSVPGLRMWYSSTSRSRLGWITKPPLQEEKRVLVVDIGGGTTDCSLLLMGPQWRSRLDREASLLGHSGCRIGGNDLDIALAFKT